VEALIPVRSGQKESAFGPYMGEILRVEGFNWYRIEELEGHSRESLCRYGLIVLSRCFVSRGEAEASAGYVNDGGRLICFRPCLRLGQALGLESTFAAQKGGYLLADSEQPTGLGISNTSVQIHGIADHWRVPDKSGYHIGARLGEQRNGSWDHPALTWGDCGRGRIAVFTYDLPAAVAAIRQGDRARANTLLGRADGIYRASELLIGHLDEARRLIPQADVHTALLANVIDALAEHPLPRPWYYPSPVKRSVFVMTSDDDWSKGQRLSGVDRGRREAPRPRDVLPGPRDARLQGTGRHLGAAGPRVRRASRFQRAAAGHL
jgi:hypothetical protein